MRVDISTELDTAVHSELITEALLPSNMRGRLYLAGPPSAVAACPPGPLERL